MLKVFYVFRIGKRLAAPRPGMTSGERIIVICDNFIQFLFVRISAAR